MLFITPSDLIMLQFSPLSQPLRITETDVMEEEGKVGGMESAPPSSSAA